MKKIISAIVLATLLLSLLAIGASAAYTAPTLEDALVVIRGVLNGSTDLITT